MDLSFLYKTTRAKLIVIISLITLYLSGNVCQQVIFVVLFLPVVLYLYVQDCYTYWERRGIPFVPGKFPFGVLKEVLLQRITISHKWLRVYRKIGDKGYMGVYLFLQPQLLIKDSVIIKNVLVDDFNYFSDRGFYNDTNIDPLLENLFFLEGKRWKDLRSRIGTSFTSERMKTLYPTVKNISDDLKTYILNLNTDILDMKDITARFGLDVVASVAMGLAGNNFQEYNTDMRKISRLFTSPSILQLIRSILVTSSRKIAALLQVRLVPKSVADYFLQTTRDTLDYRKKNNIQRNDFFHLLMGLGEDSNKTENAESSGETQGQLSLTVAEMAAHSFVFVITGFDTSSSILCFTLYELAFNVEIQDRLLKELDSTADAEYEKLLKLPYLEMVINEALRKHTPLPHLQRICVKDYTLPDGTVIKAGTDVIIPVIGLHRDPELFPEPDKFDPERFSPENISKIKPYSFLPFGEGPRKCIGKKFAMMQIKIALATILSRFRVALAEKTPLHLKIEKKTLLYNPEGILWLRLIDRNNL